VLRLIGPIIPINILIVCCQTPRGYTAVGLHGCRIARKRLLSNGSQCRRFSYSLLDVSAFGSGRPLHGIIQTEVFMTEHSNYKFSITIQSADLAVVNCLRGLSLFSQKSGNNRISWGGTGEREWRRDSNQVTFRFNAPSYRAAFLTEAERLLPKQLWSVVRQSDQDPATSRHR
jgi:hypothetical protein